MEGCIIILMLRERKRLRLKDFDYSSENAYFFTINTKNSDNWFCYIEDGIMNLNPFGKIVEKCWYDLQEYYKNCILAGFIIMPNHFRGIIIIDNKLIEELNIIEVGKGLEGDGLSGEDLKPYRTHDWLKKIKLEVSKYQWHRSFYEKIIRNEKEYINIKNYIINNPINWEKDENKNKSNINYSKIFFGKYNI